MTVVQATKEQGGHVEPLTAHLRHLGIVMHQRGVGGSRTAAHPCYLLALMRAVKHPLPLRQPRRCRRLAWPAP